jgi:oligopeptide/dipeptide ABC transporter ATP-binding protein
VVATASPVLEVSNLSVTVPVGAIRRATVVDDVSLSIDAGRTVGLVGESGSGKSMTSLAIMGLLPTVASIETGDVRLDGESLLDKSAKEMTEIRGKRMSMVMQDPMTSMDPSFTLRSQLAEPLRKHRRLHGQQLDDAIVTSLEQVYLAADMKRQRQFPHQLSGGMRQRACSAIALAGQPRLLIADEPTTALDVTTQARYLRVLRELQENVDFALLLISHDLYVVRHMCERVLIMYSSQVVEEGPAAEVFANPQHPYTRALIDAIPKPGENSSLESISGQAPDVSEEIGGCRFAARCKFARDVCRSSAPELSTRAGSRVARCWGTDEGGWVTL